MIDISPKKCQTVNNNLRILELYMVIFYLAPLVQYQNDKWSSSSGWLIGNNLRDLEFYNPRVQKKARIARWRNCIFTFGRLSIDTDATSKRILNGLLSFCLKAALTSLLLFRRKAVLDKVWKDIVLMFSFATFDREFGVKIRF